MATLNLQVGAGADDGSVFNGGYNPAASQPIIFGSFAGRRHSHWYRFTGVSGLSGATIDSAILTFNDGGPYGEFAGLSKFYAEMAAAPAAPIDNADYFAKTRTAAHDWNHPTPSWGSSIGSPTATSPDIKSVIQEVADSFDPSAILILFEFIGGAWFKIFTTYEGDPALAVKLDIDYTPSTVAWRQDDATIAAGANSATVSAGPVDDRAVGARDEETGDISVRPEA